MPNVVVVAWEDKSTTVVAQAVASQIAAAIVVPAAAALKLLAVVPKPLVAVLKLPAAVPTIAAVRSAVALESGEAVRCFRVCDKR